MKTLLIRMLLFSVCLSGCATSASRTWICENGVCVGAGITLTKTDNQYVDVAMDSFAEKSARDPNYFKTPLMIWGPEYSVGVKQMDEQHIKMIHMANTLHEAILNGDGDSVLGMIFSGLVSYTATHFRDEEKLMAAYGYPDLALHKKEHVRLVNQVMELKRKFESGQNKISLEVKDFIRDWVNYHIQGEDNAYGIYFNARGVY